MLGLTVSSHTVRGAGSAEFITGRETEGGRWRWRDLRAAGCYPGPPPALSPAPGLGGGTLGGEKGTKLEPQVAQAQLENQVGPVVAEMATGRGKGRLRRAGSHSWVLASATRGGLVVGTSHGPQEREGAGCWDPAKRVALQCMWPGRPSVPLGSFAGGWGSPPR